MFDFGKQKVEVHIIDADDGKVIARSVQSPNDIPERFDEATTIHLGDVEFDVVEADPPDRATYTKSRKLRLKVRKAVVQVAAPEDILFSLPTICNDIGNVVPADVKDKQIFEMHEDDWRQVELISRSLSNKIDLELAGIEEIFREKRVPPGFFQAIHVRKEIREPLVDSRLSLSYLKAHLKVTKEFDGVAYFNTGGMFSDGLVEHGFAFEGIGGITVYGLCKNDMVMVAGLTITTVENPESAADALSTLLSEFELLFVDWCIAASINTKSQLQRHFETMGGS